MLHVATVHFKSSRWIPLQLSYLRRNINVPFETWTSLEGIDPAEGAAFDHVLDQKAPHPEKLNHLAIEICHGAAESDPLLFLDGDAFPIADIAPLLAALDETPLIAVRRKENAGEPYPHPCFCLTTAGFWRSLPGDWSRGYVWHGTQGERFSDVGANLWRTLQLRGVSWRELRRTNPAAAHDIRFGVYGGIAYHHGSGFHPAERTARDDPGLAGVRAPEVPVLGQVVRRLDRQLRQRRRHRRDAVLERESEHVFQRLVAGDIDALSGPREALLDSRR